MTDDERKAGIRERVQRWRQRHPERNREQQRRWVENNREHLAEYYKANAARFRGAQRARYAANIRLARVRAAARKKEWYSRLTPLEKARQNALDILSHELAVPRSALPKGLVEAKTLQLAVGRMVRETDDNT